MNDSSPRPLPTGKEIHFGHDELFFSRTDSKGIIEFGNEVFVRVSAYPRERLLRSPHNIVRHPEMPKAVFRLFWNSLLAGRPIAAYVNNLNARGEHYWVKAVAFPVRGGFLSIRLRPSSRYFDVVRDLYQDLLRHERSEGVDSALARLGELLREKGFTSYEAFMTESLRAELLARDLQLKARPAATGSGSLVQVRQAASQGSRTFLRLFLAVENFGRTKEVFVTHTRGVLESFHSISHLPLNMTVIAEKLGSAGRTLSVVSAEFKILSDQVESQLRGFIDSVELIETGIRESSFGISALKVQMDMVEFFVNESLGNIAAGAVSREAGFDALRANQEHFLTLSRDSLGEVLLRLKQLRSKLQQFLAGIGEIETFISGIEIVRQKGRVESSLDPGAELAFEHQLSELRQFSLGLRKISAVLRASTGSLLGEVNSIEEDIGSGVASLQRIFALALAASKFPTADATPSH